MIEDSDIDEMHPAGAWEANGMSEQDELEAKWIRVQASLDELGDALAIRLRDIVGQIREEEYQRALLLLESTIESIEVFSGPGSTEDD